MKIILHEDLCDNGFTYAFQYLMIHVFISLLKYIMHFQKNMYSCIFVTILQTGFITAFNKHFSMITTHFGNYLLNPQKY